MKIVKNDEFCTNSNENAATRGRLLRKNKEKLTKFCEYLELGEVRRCVTLVDLEKC